MFNLIPWRQTCAVTPEQRQFGLLHNDFDTLFDNLFAGLRTSELSERSWGIDAEENEQGFVVKFELPGFATDELDVQLKENRLTVIAERKGEGDKQQARFEKSVVFPDNIDVEKIDAKHKDGVLEIHAPKKPEAVGRRIEVKS